MGRIFVTLVSCFVVLNTVNAKPMYTKHYKSSHTMRTSKCKTASCKVKHPSGSYVHPITRKKHH